jgi:hypothetical protein
MSGSGVLADTGVPQCSVTGPVSSAEEIPMADQEDWRQEPREKDEDSRPAGGGSASLTISVTSSALTPNGRAGFRESDQ